MKLVLKIYRWLAEAFPHEFKMVYGTEVIQLGEDTVEEISRQHGAAGLIRLIADIAIRIPVEYLSEMRRDMKYAVRSLRKSPGFALVSSVSIGLGIGLTTTVYSSELETLFRALPGAANAKYLAITQRPVSYYYVEQFREQKSLFAGVAAVEDRVQFNVVLSGDGNSKAQRVPGQLVSPDYFAVLGVGAQRGRVLNDALDKPGSPPSVVITDRFWRIRMNSSPSALGESIRVNGQIATIAGITPKDFSGAAAEEPAEILVPTTVPASLAPELANDALHQRSARQFQALVCLAPGVKIDSAEAALDAIARRLDQQDPEAPSAADKGRRVTLIPAGTMEAVPRDVKAAAVGFFITLMALVMTIVSMNLANMLLARGAARRKELAIRLSVGASRARLVRQMVSEGMLLSLIGGVAGFAFAQVLAALTSQVNQPLSPTPSTFTLDWRAGIFAFGVAVVFGIGFSLLPALRATKSELTSALKQGSALQLPGYRRFGLRNFLMVSQIAGSLMLLLMTGFLALGVTKASSVQTRFDPKTMYLLWLDPVRDGYTPEKAEALFEKLPRQLETIQGVRSITLAAQAPYSFGAAEKPVTGEDAQGSNRIEAQVRVETVGAGYFAALNEPVVAGREFNQQDERMSPRGSNRLSLPAVLSESAAHDLFGSRNPIGERVREGGRSFQVAGVVHDLKNGMARRHAVVYLPLTRSDFARPPAGGMTLIVRADVGAVALDGIRREIAAIDPSLTIVNARTFTEYLDFTRSVLRIALRVYGGIGLFGMVLAAVGLAGVTAYVVAQRRKEIGIRMALGARKMQVLALVLREGTALVTIGSVLGFVGAMAMAKILSALTSIFTDAFSIGTNDPRLILGAPLLLASLATIACYVPARRLIKTDPLKALREE